MCIRDRSKSSLDMCEMKAVSFNARSIRNKINEFKAIVYIENYDIITINETWCNFKDRDFVSEFQINGYKLYFKDRNNNKEGGGVMIYIKNIYLTTQLELADVNEIDILGVKIETSNIKLNLINVYRPPSSQSVIDLSLIHI